MDDADIARLVNGAPHISLDEIVGHPRLPEARRLHLDRLLAIYDNDPFLVRLLIESGRFLAHKIIIVLSAVHDPANRESWLTIGHLKQHMAKFGLASDRHLDHLVARLRSVGFVELVPSADDRRVKLLRPTDKMLAHDRDWIAAQYAPLTVLCPDNDYTLAMQGDPTFQIAQARVAMQLLPLVARLLASVPEMTLFFERAAGHLILAALLQAALADPDEQHAAVPYADIGDRFGVSRTHVRHLLAAAQDLGLVKVHARGGQRVEILPRLWESHARGIATGMYLHDIAYAIVTNRQPARHTVAG